MNSILIRSRRNHLLSESNHSSGTHDHRFFHGHGFEAYCAEGLIDGRECTQVCSCVVKYLNLLWNDLELAIDPIRYVQT